MDTMFPDISVMRYTVDMYRVMDSWQVVIRAYEQTDLSFASYRVPFFVSGKDLKAQDLLHVLGEVVMEVAASTP